MSASKEKIPAKFQEMNILMGGNPNYGDIKKYHYNRTTGLLEDEGVTSCHNCLAVIPRNVSLCPECKAVTV